MPLKVKPAPLGAICEMVRAAAPELLRVSESVFLDPASPDVPLTSILLTTRAGGLCGI